MQYAVSILRVSTKKQLNEGEGIENQRRGNAEYISRKGYTLLQEYVIAESAEGEDREKFEAAFREIVLRKKEIDVVVFWKIDRISRGGVVPYYTLKGILAKHGIRVEFATEQIDGSPTGELMETLLAGMARFENRLRVERTIGVEKILTRDGYWCRGAPTGFRNARLEGKPILLPSEEPGQWDLLCEGLRKQLTGAYKVADIARDLRRRGMKTNRGGSISVQTWTNICRGSVYGGLLGGEWNDNQYVRAKFDGPLTPEEWHELQAVLDGRKQKAARPPREKHHPDFPLRQFLLCPSCEKPARGYHVHRGYGRTHSYYDCGNRKCRFRVQAHKAHDAFVKLLNQITFPPEMAQIFEESVRQQWKQKTASLWYEWQAADLHRTKLEEEKATLVTLLKRNAENGSLFQEFERDYERVEDDLHVLGKELLKLQKAAGSVEEVVSWSVEKIRALGDAWVDWPVETQGRVQRLLFPAGLPFDEIYQMKTPSPCDKMI